MPKRVYNDYIRGRVEALLKERKSNYIIINELREENIAVNQSYISRVKTATNENGKKKKKPRKRGARSKLTKVQIRRLKREFLKDNPKTISELAEQFALSRAGIIYYKKKIFGFKKRCKPRVHALTPQTMEQRRQRSWPLYTQMKGNRWKNWICCDEKKFVLGSCNSNTTIYYQDIAQPRVPPKFIKPLQGEAGVMVWGAISARGKSELIIIPPNCKVNSLNYINLVLKPFFHRDLPVLYPDGNYTFQQDSAPSHRSNLTQN